MTVKVSSIRKNITAVRLGTNKVYHLPSLKDQYKKICDYLLITCVNNTNYAIFIELKKTLGEEDKPYEQLRRSRPLLDYFLSACDVEYGEKGKLQRKPEVRYVLIAERPGSRFDKQYVRPDSVGGGRHRHKPMTIRYKSITIKTFLGSRVSFQDLIKR